MMNAKMNKTMLLAGVATVAFAGSIWAATQNVDVEAQFRVALTLTSTQMDFTPGMQYIEFSSTPAPGAGDYVTLGTDGTLTSNGNLTDNASSGTPGVVQISGDASSTVDVTCSVSAILANVSGTDTIGVTNLEIVQGTSPSAFSLGTQCDGVGGANILSFDLNGDPTNDSVLLGGQVGGAALTGSYQSEIFSTLNPNGVQANVQVVYK